jgi:hypothetical protein
MNWLVSPVFLQILMVDLPLRLLLLLLLRLLGSGDIELERPEVVSVFGWRAHIVHEHKAL